MLRPKPTGPLLSQIFELTAVRPLPDRIIYDVRDLLGVDHIIYTTALSMVDPRVKPLVRTTYPALWLKRYVDMSYENVDPILRRGYASALPFMWSEVEVHGADAASMMSDAAGHGVGPNGLSIPVVSKASRRGLFSLVSSGGATDWGLFCTERLPQFIQVAHRLHRTFAISPVEDPPLQLSGREIECLSWCAQGKEASDIAAILGLSIHTVREYLKSARYKLDCTNLPQAVAKAIERGFI